MSNTIPPVLIELQADVASLKTGLQQAQDAIKGVDKSVKDSASGMNNFIGKLKQVGTAMGAAFAGTQVVQFGKDVLMAASDMNESLSKINVVFGENSDAVIKWADNSSTSMGISKQAALEAAGTYGNLFQAFGLGQGQSQEMSTSLVQLASDMASFNNTSIDDAILALRSGLSGETEPLKRFGVALSDTRLKTQALSMGLISSTSEALTPAIKAQASYALILNDTKLAQGDFGRTSDGTANTMKIVAAQMQNAKVALGQALLPAFQALLLVLKPVIAALTKFGEFINKNKTTLAVFVGVLAAGYAAMKAYGIITKATAFIQEAWTIAVAVSKGVKLTDIAVTDGMAGSMAILNAVMEANPIGLIVIALALLAAGFVYAWNHSETFRKVVVAVAKGVLTYVSFMIKAYGQFIEILLKVITGPMQMWLTLLSKLPGVGKYAKEGLDFIKNGIGKVGDFADAAAGKVDEFKNKLDGMANKTVTVDVKADVVPPGGDDKGGGGGGGDGKGMTKEEKKKALEKLNTTVKDTYAKMNKIILDARTKSLEMEKEFNKKVVEINKTYADKALALQKEYADKGVQLEMEAAEKRGNVIQKSKDLLIAAFQGSTKLDLADLMKDSDGSGETMVQRMKEKYAKIIELQKKAGELASKGFSQTFIQQVIAQGPDAGNAMADSILSSSPETIGEIKTLYGKINDVSENGMNTLADQMYSGMGLATSDLAKEYAQIGIDLDQALKDNSTALTDALAENQKNLQDSLLEAQTAYNDAIDALQKDTLDKLAALQDELKKTAAEIVKLSGAKAGTTALAGSPAAPIIAGTATLGLANKSTGSLVVNNNISVSGTNLADPQAAADQVERLTRFGGSQALNNKLYAYNEGIM